MSREQIAKRLYEEYCKSSGNLNYQGNQCPAWMDLPSRIVEHWMACAAWVDLMIKGARSGHV